MFNHFSKVLTMVMCVVLGIALAKAQDTAKKSATDKSAQNKAETPATTKSAAAGTVHRNAGQNQMGAIRAGDRVRAGAWQLRQAWSALCFSIAVRRRRENSSALASRGRKCNGDIGDVHGGHGRFL